MVHTARRKSALCGTDRWTGAFLHSSLPFFPPLFLASRHCRAFSFLSLLSSLSHSPLSFLIPPFFKGFMHSQSFPSFLPPFPHLLFRAILLSLPSTLWFLIHPRTSVLRYENQATEKDRCNRRLILTPCPFLNNRLPASTCFCTNINLKKNTSKYTAYETVFAPETLRPPLPKLRYASPCKIPTS